MTAVPITLTSLGKSFGASAAVDDVSIEIPAGAFVVLLGPSGCGKTTTLRMLAGLEDPTIGTIAIGDRVVADGGRGLFTSPGKRGIGLVFQSYALWPHMTVRQNVEWPLQVADWSADDRRARVADVLDLLEIADLADRTPSAISGGQQQRVAIARTIAPRPPVLLFDEPLSNLDARLRVEMRAELVRVHRASGATSVYVTHDQIEALAMATHVAVMRGGRVEQFGTPDELIEHPATAFVASFVGTPPAALLEVVERDGMLWRGGVAIAETARHPAGSIVETGLRPGASAGTGLGADGSRDEASDPRVRAMYRPDSLRLASATTPGLPFEVIESTPLAGRHLVAGITGGTRIAIVLDHAATMGDRATLVLPERPAALFDAAGVRMPEFM